MSISPSPHIAGGWGGLVHLPAKGKPMFDITSQAVADTAFIHFKALDGSHLYDDGKPVGVRLYSPGSTEYAEVEDRQSARIRVLMEDNDGKYVPAPRDVRDAEAADDLASLTASFENFGYPPAGDRQGKELYRAFYSDRKLGHFKAQVTKAPSAWGKFAPTPSEG
jgi:hypothetical protein